MARKAAARARGTRRLDVLFVFPRHVPALDQPMQPRTGDPAGKMAPVRRRERTGRGMRAGRDDMRAGGDQPVACAKIRSHPADVPARRSPAYAGRQRPQPLDQRLERIGPDFVQHVAQVTRSAGARSGSGRVTSPAHPGQRRSAAFPAKRHCRPVAPPDSPRPARLVQAGQQSAAAHSPCPDQRRYRAATPAQSPGPSATSRGWRGSPHRSRAGARRDRPLPKDAIEMQRGRRAPPRGSGPTAGRKPVADQPAASSPAAVDRLPQGARQFHGQAPRGAKRMTLAPTR